MKKFFHLFFIFLNLFFLSFQQKEIRPRHEVLVQLVLVDFIAKDKKGNFVTDLKKEEIEVFEDGYPVPIQYFNLISYEERLEEIKTKEVEEKKEQKKEKEISLPEKKRLILIFDNINTFSTYLDWARPKLIEILNNILDKNTEIMVVEFNKKEGMKIIYNFTSNHKIIKEFVKCIFRSKVAIDSDSNRPLILIESGHPFRFIPATFSMKSEFE
ncbi:MAG: hypothetical protein AB1410_02750, partial [Acidobacteriota bacterium]